MNKKKATKMNPYMKEGELNPCSYCKLTKRAHNNITSMIDEKELKVKNNKNNLSQKTMFGTPDKDVKKVKNVKKKKK